MREKYLYPRISQEINKQAILESGKGDQEVIEIFKNLFDSGDKLNFFIIWFDEISWIYVQLVGNIKSNFDPIPPSLRI